MFNVTRVPTKISQDDRERLGIMVRGMTSVQPIKDRDPAVFDYAYPPTHWHMTKVEYEFIFTAKEPLAIEGNEVRKIIPGRLYGKSLTTHTLMHIFQMDEETAARLLALGGSDVLDIWNIKQKNPKTSKYLEDGATLGEMLEWTTGVRKKDSLTREDLESIIASDFYHVVPIADNYVFVSKYGVEEYSEQLQKKIPEKLRKPGTTFGQLLEGGNGIAFREPHSMRADYMLRLLGFGVATNMWNIEGGVASTSPVVDTERLEEIMRRITGILTVSKIPQLEEDEYDAFGDKAYPPEVFSKLRLGYNYIFVSRPGVKSRLSLEFGFEQTFEDEFKRLTPIEMYLHNKSLKAMMDLLQLDEEYALRFMVLGREIGLWDVVCTDGGYTTTVIDRNRSRNSVWLGVMLDKRGIEYTLRLAH